MAFLSRYFFSHICCPSVSLINRRYFMNEMFRWSMNNYVSSSPNGKNPRKNWPKSLGCSLKTHYIACNKYGRQVFFWYFVMSRWRAGYLFCWIEELRFNYLTQPKNKKKSKSRISTNINIEILPQIHIRLWWKFYALELLSCRLVPLPWHTPLYWDRTWERSTDLEHQH